jgi:oligopeptide/dipeptide ABC transporter ATP-binding protein
MLLEVNGLRVRYRWAGWLRATLSGIADPFLDAVLGVDMALARGETLALVGESGSGKTTLGRAIVGLVRPDQGSVAFDGRILAGEADRREVRRDMAMMFQDPISSLSPRKTVHTLLSEPFIVHRVAADREAEIRRLLGLVGLDDRFLRAYPHQLSGGQARRVGVARALALSPRLVVADEPTAGLDVSVQGEVLNLMTRLGRMLGVSYLFITHNLPVVRHVSDRVAIMYMGRFVEQGPTEALLAHPAHPYTRALIDAVPVPDPARRLHPRPVLRGEVPSLRHRPAGCEFHARCAFAQPRCATEPPPVTIAQARMVRCHFPLG